MALPIIKAGIGIYSRPDAARLLGVTPSRLRRWVSGYTYRNNDGPRMRHGTLPPVIRADLPVIQQTISLSFAELMELRVVKALVDRGLPLQQVRRAATIAATTFKTLHPFASRRVYTDGQQVFAALASGVQDP